MVLPVPPTKFTCEKCGWSKTTFPQSDALVDGVDWYLKCPKCGSENLETKQPSVLDMVVNVFKK